MINLVKRERHPTAQDLPSILGDRGHQDIIGEPKIEYAVYDMTDRWFENVKQLSTSPLVQESDLSQLFMKYAAEWRSDTSHLSSIDRKIQHPSYLRIIGMGLSVVPLIIRELKEKPDHWFYALSIITGENPVKPEDAGKMSRMQEAWVNWARMKGII